MPVEAKRDNELNDYLSILYKIEVTQKSWDAYGILYASNRSLPSPENPKFRACKVRNRI